MLNQIHPYTEAELKEFGNKLYKALKPKYPQIEKIDFKHEDEERWKGNWHIVDVDIDWPTHRNYVNKISDENLLDHNDSITDMDKFSKFSIKAKDNIRNDIKFLLNVLKYKSKDLEYDPHISV